MNRGITCESAFTVKADITGDTPMGYLKSLLIDQLDDEEEFSLRVEKRSENQQPANPICKRQRISRVKLYGSLRNQNSGILGGTNILPCSTIGHRLAVFYQPKIKIPKELQLRLGVDFRRDVTDLMNSCIAGLLTRVYRFGILGAAQPAPPLTIPTCT